MIPDGHPSTWTADQVQATTPTERLHLALVAHATTARFHRPEVAAELIDPATVRQDASGAYVGAQEAVQALARAHPWLVAPGPPQGADGGAARGAEAPSERQSQVNAALRRAALEQAWGGP